MNVLIRCAITLAGVFWANSAIACSAYASASPGHNTTIYPGGCLVSPNGSYTLIMQGDGNLVAYRSNALGNPNAAVWQSGTSGIQNLRLAVQEDGNLVLYDNHNSAIWNAGSAGQKGRYFLVIQDDGNVVIYRGASPRDNRGAVWSYQTGFLAAAASPPDARIELGWGDMNLTPCSKIEWRQIFSPTLRAAPQRWYAYANINMPNSQMIENTIKNCAFKAAAVTTIAAIFASPSAATPTFWQSFKQCMSSAGEDAAQSVVSLSIETKCDWDHPL